jgi:hypothetical protein
MLDNDINAVRVTVRRRPCTPNQIFLWITFNAGDPAFFISFPDIIPSA